MFNSAPFNLSRFGWHFATTTTTMIIIIIIVVIVIILTIMILILIIITIIITIERATELQRTILVGTAHIGGPYPSSNAGDLWLPWEVAIV